MANTKRVTSSGQTGIVESVASINFYQKEVNDTINIQFNNNPTFLVGDILILNTGNDEIQAEFDDEYSIRVSINSIVGGLANVVILNIDEDLAELNQTQQWDVRLKQDEPLFESKFVRFGYRYKYKDGQFSTFSPFSEVAFLPRAFEYNPKKGYNLGMVNDLRYLKISDFIPNDLPKQVEEVEVIYKDEVGNNVYTVKAFKKGDEEWENDVYEIESELIYKTIESNQLLRPYDNVPLKAKAQELVGNRIVYGNYVQNFNLKDANNNDVNPVFETSLTTRSNYTPGTAEKSLKSQRTYQLGVVYRDEYGRETPVLTDTTGSIKVSKDNAINYNKLQAKITSQPPSFASTFKYFIKETSNEYYNLAMDRWYDAEDGNIWLSFPSSERNKVTEESFIILKKQHDNNNFVSEEAKYKIIAIENEAPIELKLFKTSYGTLETGFDTSGYPTEEGTSVVLAKSEWEDRFGEDSIILSQSNRYIRIVSNNNNSNWYEVTDVSINTSTNKVTINISTKFGEEVNAFGTFASPVIGVGFELAKEETKQKKEFGGRFFAKVYRDYVLEQNLLQNEGVGSYSIKAIVDMWKNSYAGNSTGPYENLMNDGKRWRLANCGFNEYKGPGPLGTMPSLMNVSDSASRRSIKAGSSIIGIDFLGSRTKDGALSIDGGAYSAIINAFTTDGTKFRFAGDPQQTIYTIEKHAYRGIRLYNKPGNDSGWPSNQAMRMAIKLDKPITSYALDTALSEGTADQIEFIQNYDNEEAQFTSENPAIFETEPKEAIDVDLYYEIEKAYPISDHGSTQDIQWFNCYSFGNGVESNRIRDDFNAPTIKKGVKASTVLAEQYKEERRKNGLIFSQIYNSTSGINRLNQFILAEPITKDLNPEYGSIQKLHQRDTDLIALCEDKILKILANKDALFEAGGNAQLTANNRVLGQAVPYVGEYGISKNPESFASFGFRAYFSDKARGSIMRLSRDGLTEISMYGMTDYFRDNLSLAVNIIGSYDDKKDLYNVTFKGIRGNDVDDTVSFSENVKGWPSRKSFIPEIALSLNNIYYSFYQGELYSHDNIRRNTFYGNFQNTSLTMILNDFPGLIKSFKTLNYEGTKSRIVQESTNSEISYSLDNINSGKGWFASDIETNLQSGSVPEFVEKESKWFNFIQGDGTTLDNLDTQEFSVQGIDEVASIDETSPQVSVVITVQEDNYNGE